MKNLLATLAVTLLVSCGGGGGGNDGPTSPPTGGGGGGTTTPDVPAEGTLLRSGCSSGYPGVKWFVYADGNGGEYKDRDKKSVECGYIPVEVVNEVGDRFVPVVFRPDNPNTAEFSVTLGYAQLVDDEIHVLGDGRLGEGTITIDDFEFTYTIEEEPRCEKNGSYDCMGYRFNANSPPFIYYGEEDDRMVIWELGIIDYYPDAPLSSEVYQEIERGTQTWDNWEYLVSKYNTIYERSGIHVRFVLKSVVWAKWGNLAQVEQVAARLPVDIAIGKGWTCPETCGCAYYSNRFVEGRPPTGVSQCENYVDIHEMGHTLGLAHGPENRANPDTGHIWPEFGHGSNWSYCGAADLMSYEPAKFTHLNSMVTCEEMFPDTKAGDTTLSINREISDAGYAINRVRYDVSLVNPENDWRPEASSALQFIRVEAREAGRTLILD